MAAVEEAPVTVRARDGFALAATRFAPAASSGHVTVMASAMGVPRGFYARFCHRLARAGHTVYSMDYRGIGGSMPDQGLLGFEASLSDWAGLDLAGLIDHVLAAEDASALHLVGHSLAGQILGLVPNADRIDRALLVASVKGHWRLWSGRSKVLLWLLSHAALPGIAHLLGYVPVTWLGLGGEDIPRDVALDWARWIRHRDYVVDEDGRHPREGYQAVRADVFGASVSDDWYAPPRGVQDLLEMYPNARLRHETITPEHLGVPEIGHFGFFRPSCDALWPQAAAWLSGTPVGSLVPPEAQAQSER